MFMNKIILWLADQVDLIIFTHHQYIFNGMLITEVSIFLLFIFGETIHIHFNM